jgi:type II secretory pathway predicted ATPase ExeA
VQPPSSPPDLGEPLYETFYGLREQPFTLATDPRFLYLSASHRRAYEELLTGLRRREGILLLTGETGTGKTTLCRAVIDALGHRTFAALILNPYMSDSEVLRVILRDFGLVSRDEIRRGVFARADVPQLLDTLEGFLRSLVPLNSFAVVIIDEAQSLSPTVLDQVRMLGAYEQDGQRLLQIVLVGQPGLANTLRSEPLIALNERVTRRTALAPLSTQEVDDYIRHRLTIAGGRDSVKFLPDAIQLIHELSRGLPRRINVLCDRALEEGRISGKNEINSEMIRRAARSIAGAATAAEGAPAPQVPPTPAMTAADAAIAPAETPDVGLTFGMAEKPPRNIPWVGIGIGMLILAALIALAMYLRGIVVHAEAMPVLPSRPPVNVGQPPPAVIMPTEGDIKAWGEAIKFASERL